MPRVMFEMLEGRSLDVKRALAKEISQAISECYELPIKAAQVRFVEIKLEDFANSGELRWDTSLREGKPVYGRMLEPRINIQFLALYTPEMKRKLVKRITEVVIKILQVEPFDVRMYLEEMQLDQYAAGGVMASESTPPEHKKH